MSLKSHNSIKQIYYLKKIEKDEKYKGIILKGIILIKTQLVIEGSIWTCSLNYKGQREHLGERTGCFPRIYQRSMPIYMFTLVICLFKSWYYCI